MEYWEIKTGGPSELGIDGGLYKRDRIGQWTTPFISFTTRFQLFGKYPTGGKNFQPKSAIPGIGYTLLFKDTESNTIGLFVENKNAK